jgi:23S rRNA (uracil1939-C5)-methyltransferase
VLYSKAIEFANLSGTETIFDLYCGIGTIGIFASKNVKRVYGIELVENAIKDAKQNAKENEIENAEFIVGEVESVLPKLIEEEKIEADVVFLDPPRKGSDKLTLETLKQVKPKKIVYISCNPATLARDINFLEDTYSIEKVQPVDMFPFTNHVECVALLCLK